MKRDGEKKSTIRNQLLGYWKNRAPSIVLEAVKFGVHKCPLFLYLTLLHCRPKSLQTSWSAPLKNTKESRPRPSARPNSLGMPEYLFRNFDRFDGKSIWAFKGHIDLPIGESIRFWVEKVLKSQLSVIFSAINLNFVWLQKKRFFFCFFLAEVGYRFWPLAILVSNKVWFSHSCLELVMIFRRSYFFIIIDKTINRRFWS